VCDGCGVRCDVCGVMRVMGACDGCGVMRVMGAMGAV
jgi:hypothetical protein